MIICPEKPVFNPFNLMFSILRRRNALQENWPQFKERDVVLTYQGRTAVNLVCRLLHLDVNEEILLPSYNCGTEVDAIIETGAKVIMYRVDEQCHIDLDDIIRRTTNRTRIIYVIHYFGWPQDISELARWCLKKGIILFEDCALSLFSFGKDAYTGMQGDVAIFSFSKSLPVPDGGALTIRSGVKCEPKKIYMKPPSIKVSMVNMLRIFKRWFLSKELFIPLRMYLTIEGRNKKKRRGGTNNDKGDILGMPSNYYFEHGNHEISISMISQRIAESVVPDNIISIRRRNYEMLYEMIYKLKNITPIFPILPGGVCPLSLPVLVSNRRDWINALRQRGIGVGPWWGGYHKRLVWDEYLEARKLKDHVLTLPVHQDLKERHIDYIGNSVTFISKLYS